LAIFVNPLHHPGECVAMPRSALHIAHALQRWLWLCGTACALALPATPARADGCTVLLCLAGNWRSISQCVPPVRRALRDLAAGRSLPVCSFASLPDGISLDAPSRDPDDATAAQPLSGTATRALLRWATEGYCPEQYLTPIELESATAQACRYAGAIEISLGGQLWNRTWWNSAGDTVTEWSPTARRSLGAALIDDRFEREHQAWRATRGEPPHNGSTPAPEGGA
jgi:hypothetical protein